MENGTIQPGADSESPAEDKRGWSRYFHGFFVIPAIVVIIGLMMFYVFAAARAKPSVARYLEVIGEGHHNARWQAAVELSRLLSDPEQVPTDPSFVETMTDLFADAAAHEGLPRVRLFLALAMGRTRNPEFYDPLISALAGASGRVEEESVYIRAVGFLGDKRAVDVLLPLLANPDVVVRHESVQALGSIGDARVCGRLREMLADPEANVRWDAAVSLAKLGDISGRSILANLMDRSYYAAFPDVRPEGRAWAMQVAVRAAALLDDSELNERIRELSESDPNIKVRGAALEAVNQYQL